MAIKPRIEPPVDIQVKQTEKIFLTVTIGNQQIGGSIVEFAGDAEPFAKGRIKNVELGKGAKLVGEQLLIETNVLDSNTAMNRIVVKHVFINDKNNEVASFEYKDEVENHRDILSLKTTYNFKKNA